MYSIRSRVEHYSVKRTPVCYYCLLAQRRAACRRAAVPDRAVACYLLVVIPPVA